MLSYNLKYLMLNAGITSHQLSLATNIERSTLTKILNASTTNPRIDTVQTLAKYFGVTVTELLDNNYAKEFQLPKCNLKLKDILQNLMIINGISTISMLNKYTGISLSILSDILNGKTENPHIKTLKKLADFFHVNTSQLIGKERLPHHKTVSIIPSKRIMPILELNQIADWLSGKINSVESYHLDSSRAIISNKSYVLKITNEEFFPDFTKNHLLVIDTDTQFKENDFIICSMNNQISIFECIQIMKGKPVIRKAGSHNRFDPQINLIVLGVVIQQIINR